MPMGCPFCDSRLLQVSPLRSFHSNVMNSECRTPIDRLLQRQFSDSELLQSPQNSRAMHIYAMNNSQCRTPKDRLLQRQFSNSELLQSPQNSRAMHSYAMKNSDCRTPKDRLLQRQFSDPELLQFLKISRTMQSYAMINSDCRTPKDIFLHQSRSCELLEQLPHDSRRPLHNYSVSFDQSCDAAATLPTNQAVAAAGGEGEGEALDELLLSVKEFLEEVDVESLELLRKYFSRLEDDIPLHNHLRERLQDSTVRAISTLFERIPANHQGQVSLEGIKVPTTKQRSSNLCPTSMRSLHGSLDELSHRLERFKIRTLDLGGVIKGEPK